MPRTGGAPAAHAMAHGNRESPARRTGGSCCVPVSIGELTSGVRSVRFLVILVLSPTCHQRGALSGSRRPTRRPASFRRQMRSPPAHLMRGEEDVPGQEDDVVVRVTDPCPSPSAAVSSYSCSNTIRGAVREAERGGGAASRTLVESFTRRIPIIRILVRHRLRHVCFRFNRQPSVVHGAGGAVLLRGAVSRTAGWRPMPSHLPQ